MNDSATQTPASSPGWGRRALVASAVACVALIVPTQSPAGSGSSGSSSVVEGNEFSFQISPTEITVGEPVYLKLNVKNTSGMLIVSNFNGRLYLAEGNDVEVRVQEPGQLPRRYFGVEQAGIYGSTEIALNRDESSLHDFLLFYENQSDKGLLFDRPGEYLISARLSGSVYRDKPRELLTLPPTRIVVREPATEEQRAALQMIGNKEIAKVLHMAITTDKAIIDRLRAFASRFPTSPWTPMVLSVIGNELMYGLNPNPAAAAAIYGEIAKRFPDSPRAPAALFSAAAAYEQLKDMDSARANYWLLRDLYPSYPLIRKDNPLARLMEFGPIESLAGQPWFHYAKPYEMPASALVPKEK
jgi:tetratricopeptide (TPR) repeat protein